MSDHAAPDIQPLLAPDGPAAPAPSGGEAHSADAARPSAPTALELLVDPSVSRAKFEREISDYRRMEQEYLRRGWILVGAEYPQVVVLFAAPKLAPSPVLFGVVVDFTNYDFWAPSVRFVHPFTLEPLRFDQMPTRLPKRVPVSAPALSPEIVAALPDGLAFASDVPPNPPPGAGAAGLPRPDGAADGSPAVSVDLQVFQPQYLLQHQQDMRPFLCIKGVREYHDHPFHSNDPWLAYRGTGVGRLYHILNVIYRHGVVPLKHYGLQIQRLECQIGFQLPDPADIPE